MRTKRAHSSRRGGVEENKMTSTKILGLLIGAALLVGYEPIAEAMPVATPGSVVEVYGSDTPSITKAYYGVARRSARRTTRRVVRRRVY
jgi:hypothetical protein